MKRRSLDGEWELSYRDTRAASAPIGAPWVGPLPAVVPGNVELDLSRAGHLPSDLFHGENILAVRDVESYEWRYQAGFTLTAAEAAGRMDLVFGGVDGDAEYVLNGHVIGTSINSLIEHVLPLGAAARTGDNELVVVLRPQHPPVEAGSLVPLWTLGDPLREDSVWVRKAAHAYGWDIMPRALSAGVWRHVELVEHDEIEISKLYVVTTAADEGHAALRVYYEVSGDWDEQATYELVLTGRCGDSTFEVASVVYSPTGALRGEVNEPRRWWPRDYGDPDIYDLTCRLVRNGVDVASREGRLGIRTVELVREASRADTTGTFRFVVNGTPIYCRGTNWLPLDPFHSRDLDGLDQRLELLWRSNCNMVRCWGGNVYENDEFFEYCDRRGIMVWQDFALACALYPQTPSFTAELQAEVRSVVRRLRHHASIVLWCGDNEGDDSAIKHGVDPAINTVTRRAIPQALYQEDPHRPYLPSSPYIETEGAAILRTRDLRSLPETHLWGTRDYFKSDFYVGSSAAFVSEIGFMGLPAAESLRRFLDEECLWPFENRQWLVHGTDPTVDFESRYWHRTAMTFECIRQFFGEIPSDLDGAILASQMVQAEGFKFAIEIARQRKWDRTGVLWWNLVDGWPQISDAVVDYYLNEKLALAYITRSQRALALVIGEPIDGRHPILACNDTRRDVSGRFRVWSADGSEDVLTGRYESPANATSEIGSVRMPSTPALLIVDWEDDDGAARNHYLVGTPPFDMAQYAKWLDTILASPDRA